MQTTIFWPHYSGKCRTVGTYSPRRNHGRATASRQTERQWIHDIEEWTGCEYLQLKMSQDRAQWRRKISEWSSAVANPHRGRSTSEWVSEWLQAYSIGDCCLSGCHQTTFKSLLLQFFSDSHGTWHTVTHDLCVITQKSLKQIFEILILKFVANFWNFTFGLSLCSSSSKSVYANRLAYRVRQNKRPHYRNCNISETAQ